MRLDKVQVVVEDVPASEELVALYRAVGWTAYAEDADTLTRAVAGSSFVVTARRDGTYRPSSCSP
jgi:hypothetical protein